MNYPICILYIKYKSTKYLIHFVLMLKFLIVYGIYSDNHYHFRINNYFEVVNINRVQTNFQSSNLNRMYNISEINNNSIINIYLK